MSTVHGLTVNSHLLSLRLLTYRRLFTSTILILTFFILPFLHYIIRKSLEMNFINSTKVEMSVKSGGIYNFIGTLE